MNEKQEQGVPDPAGKALAILESVGAMMPFADKFIQLVRMERGSAAFRRDMRNFSTLMAELSTWCESGNKGEKEKWLDDKLADPEAEEQILLEFELMRQARGRSARLSIACLLASYVGNGRPSDQFFRDAGSLLAESSDADIGALAELLDFVQRCTAVSLHINVHDAEIFATDWGGRPKDERMAPMRHSLDASRVQEFTRAVVLLKRWYFASELPGGVSNVVSAPGNMGLVVDDIRKCAELRKVLVRAPTIATHVAEILRNCEGGSTVSELQDLLDTRVPGGIQVSELRECIDHLDRDGLIEVVRDDQGKATRVYLQTTTPTEAP